MESTTETSVSDNELTCIYCMLDLPEEEKGMKCPSGHYFCPDCTVACIQNGLANPEECLPYKCYKCQEEFNFDTIISLMTDIQKQKLILHQTVMGFGKDKFQILNCPFCNEMVVWDKDSSTNLFYCPNEKCKKGSCTICSQEFKIPNKNEFTKEEENKMKKDGMLKHHNCLKYKTMKDDWDEVISKGIARECPGCHAKGVKSPDCTHMKCSNCGTSWCYFCGLDEKDCDKEDPKGNIYQHNEDWDKNPKRCPMYLLEIHEIDNRWSKDHDTKCLNFLHNILRATAIKDFFKKYTEKQFQELCDTFDEVKNHGLDLEKAKKMDLTLIKR
ncbi:unnamed protein product [Moneuplotes crassus]|uniref:RING-type domain-containing protein n=1 Tax=Euplotes crassus TaxID=5936 RepID=A0AAD1X4X4_EUPCR|nr:unnamed protein product [Moneuplotes crassus]